MSTECKIRSMTRDDLESVLQWRNHPDVRRFMLSQHEISMEEHTRWFERTSVDPDRRLLIVEDAAGPLGFVQFSGLLAPPPCEWGFYLVPGSPKGSGRQLGEAALEHAFRVMEVSGIRGEAFDFNSASVRFHQRLGFVQEQGAQMQHPSTCTSPALIRFILPRSKWLSSQRNH